ncbi:type I-E CRISPR-associated protein Cse1/CasA [Phreatobacter stygius]|uniref:Type I-E CRISPR-associated protein Cse1/CasA n=1 Tax=Phreatobacter stygius TaxID=1940610 RepID=A0A4D7B9H7_9HYPH|nr:type I-E CRISPR-associated protein Cse1/CasA [Phreatobacter stygius]QCI66838.1 type I-E CRISPR-associated protein Cse1/CasA [Phreatobacter stygius]
MPLNLISDAWLEVRRASGRRSVVAPGAVTDRFDNDPIVALDFPRADWNAALTEFLIGLTWLAMAPRDEVEWADHFRTPPSPDRLQAAFAPFASAFDFDGEGPRAFQDFDRLEAAEMKPLSGLLIDAPGENTLKNNADLFVKRGGAGGLSLPYAAAALITLQTYAPSGGAGHRTSLRGGGPLTTLLAPARKSLAVATLWDRIWANVPNADPEAGLTDLARIFPWLSPTATSTKGEIVAPEDRHPALAFFACPRRIRLDFAGEVVCAFGGRTGRGAVGYRTLNYGANYVSWEHPLSRYRNDKKAGKLPLHPHVGPSGYGDWIAWWGLKDESNQPAKPFRLWSFRRNEVADLLTPGDSAEAFGFVTDNAKAIQWLEARFPWVAIHADAYRELRPLLGDAIRAADAAARALRYTVKIAFFGQPREGSYRLPKTLPLDALPEPAERLWRETQSDFETLLGKLIQRFRDGPEATIDLKQDWRRTLRRHALFLFDDTVDIEGMTDANPRRLLSARRQLDFAFSDHAKAEVRRALNLSPAPKAPKDKEAA